MATLRVGIDGFGANSEAITVLKNVRGVTSLSGELLRTSWNAHFWEMD